MNSSSEDLNEPVEAVHCAECNTRLTEGQDRQETEDAVFCRPCFERLVRELDRVVASQGEDINYSMALLGGAGGAALGIAVWWGFTVLTSISFGLVAVVIGFAVGKGVVMFSGHKRHLNLQMMSAALSVAGFVQATYLVNRTFIHRAFAADNQEIVLPWIADPELFVNVVTAGFSPMDLVFLAIVVFQAWKIPAPIPLARKS